MNQTISFLQIKFAGKDRGSRYNREDFMEKDSLEIDTSSNPAFCRTAKSLIGCGKYFYYVDLSIFLTLTVILFQSVS